MIFFVTSRRIRQDYCLCLRNISFGTLTMCVFQTWPPRSVRYSKSTGKQRVFPKRHWRRRLTFIRRMSALSNGANATQASMSRSRLRPHSEYPWPASFKKPKACKQINAASHARRVTGSYSMERSAASASLFRIVELLPGKISSKILQLNEFGSVVF